MKTFEVGRKYKVIKSEITESWAINFRDFCYLNEFTITKIVEDTGELIKFQTVPPFSFSTFSTICLAKYQIKYFKDVTEKQLELF